MKLRGIVAEKFRYLKTLLLKYDVVVLELQKIKEIRVIPVGKLAWPSLDILNILVRQAGLSCVSHYLSPKHMKGT